MDVVKQQDNKRVLSLPFFHRYVFSGTEKRQTRNDTILFAAFPENKEGRQNRIDKKTLFAFLMLANKNKRERGIKTR